MWRTVDEDASTYTRDLPYGWDTLLENIVDTAHIPFAHHGLQGVRSDGSPIAMRSIASNATHCEVTFEDQIRRLAVWLLWCVCGLDAC